MEQLDKYEIDDMVNSPCHYTAGGIEVIDYIKSKLAYKEYTGYLLGNIIKYISRAGYKSNSVQDYKKAAWYLNELIKEEEEFNND